MNNFILDQIGNTPLVEAKKLINQTRGYTSFKTRRQQPRRQCKGQTSLQHD